jgi:hypothetical protein
MMSRKANPVYVVLLGGLFLLAADPVALGDPEIRWLPVAAEGNVICMPGKSSCSDAEITLWDGGVTVTLFMQLADWDPDDNGIPSLGGFQGTLDSATLQGGHASGIDTIPGFDLMPAGVASGTPSDGAFQALKICFDPFPDNICHAHWLTNCTSNTTGCPPFPQECLLRPDYVFSWMDNTPTVSCATADYSWGATSPECQSDDDPYLFCISSPGWWYGGTLLLEVPVGATGTYNVGFMADDDLTFFNHCDGGLIPGLVRTSAQITVIPGTDCNGNEIVDSTDIANGTSLDCDANGLPDECQPDSDGDGFIDACDICAGFDDHPDADADGVPDGCDECPNDPAKFLAGVCGCGVPDEDDDGDGFFNCHDTCPGLDDATFAPCDAEAIPTVSTWGLIIIALLLLAVAKVAFRRRVPTADQEV